MRSIPLTLLLVVAPSLLGAEDVLIQNARIFDGESVIPRASVLVRKGKIQKMGRHVRAPKKVRVVDGSGKTLIPGLIDAHTHIRSRRDLEQSVVFGVNLRVARRSSTIGERELVRTQFKSSMYQPQLPSEDEFIPE